jgi:tetratricopeptide (TPR) repeat protein
MVKILFTFFVLIHITQGFSQDNAKCDALFLKGNKQIDSIGKPNFKKAIKIYSKILKIDPNYHKALYNRGISFVGNGKLDLAIKDFNKFINIAPIEEKRKIAEAHTNRGVVYKKLNDFEKAMKDFNKALEIDEIPKAYYNRALIYRKQNNLNSACEDFHKAVKLGMKDKDNLEVDCSKIQRNK